MQYKEAITYINENAAMWLKADKSNRGYICPICGSGSGPKGTGITENPENKNHFTCWKGCFSSKSFVDIGLKLYSFYLLKVCTSQSSTVCIFF